MSARMVIPSFIGVLLLISLVVIIAGEPIKVKQETEYGCCSRERALISIIQPYMGACEERVDSEDPADAVCRDLFRTFEINYGPCRFDPDEEGEGGVLRCEGLER